MNGDKKLAAFGIAAACVISFINYVQYRDLGKRMEDLEVTAEMVLFPDIEVPQSNTKEVQEEKESDWLEDLSRPCDAGCTAGRCPAFKSFM